MAEKNIKSRIVHKHDIEENWLKAVNFIPKQGELIIYDKDANYDYVRLKIGDGITNVNSLSFADLAFERLKYYGDADIVPTDISYFTYKDNGDGTCGIAEYKDGQDLKTVVIPYKIDNMEVTSIGKLAFFNGTSLKEITIPDSVTSIGNLAFFKCTSLKEITIPDSVSIGESAFNGCTSLKEITIPDNVTSIGYGVFNGCTSLEKVTIPDSVTSIGVFAFKGCTSLKEITIPDSVTSIGESAFKGCTSLKEITIPDSVTSIDNRAFYSSSDGEIISGLTIICNQDSYAETFARENNFKYRSINGKNFYSTETREEMINNQASENGSSITQIYLTYVDLFSDNEMIFSEAPTSRTITKTVNYETQDTIEETTYRNEFAINIPDNIDFGYEAYLSFPIGDTVPTIQWTAGIIFKGADCDDEGIFTPVINTNYEIAFKYMGIDDDSGIPIIVARVGIW